MSGLIDKDELKDRLKHGWMNDKFVLRTIDEMPIVDAVHVVRCEDCRFYPNGDGAANWIPCRDMITPPKWYCADGERKDDG